MPASKLKIFSSLLHFYFYSHYKTQAKKLLPFDAARIAVAVATITNFQVWRFHEVINPCPIVDFFFFPHCCVWGQHKRENCRFRMQTRDDSSLGFLLNEWLGKWMRNKRNCSNWSNSAKWCLSSFLASKLRMKTEKKESFSNCKSEIALETNKKIGSAEIGLLGMCSSTTTNLITSSSLFICSDERAWLASACDDFLPSWIALWRPIKRKFPRH